MTTFPRSRSVAHRTLVVALLSGGVLAACGDDDTDTAVTGITVVEDGSTSTAAPDETSEATVTARGSSFEVAGAVAPGSEVTFTNDDGFAHTMTADDGSFDSGTVDGGASTTLAAPSDPGDYEFFCEIHPQMRETLSVVQE